MGRTYRIGEAARLLNLKNYVLRFWETEFPQLSPLRTDKGQRLYTEEHLEMLRTIKRLLHEEGMTIDGAKKKIGEGQRLPVLAQTDACDEARDLIGEVVDELEEIREMLVPRWPEP